MADLPTSVIRYWETEFSGIKPPRHSSGKRLYRQVDIDRILRIKELLYEQRFTIEGARKTLQDEKAARQPVQEDILLGSSIPKAEIRQDLQEILALLNK